MTKPVELSPLYHGITVRDAALMCEVSPATVRSWISRGRIVRTRDGGICPLSLREWWDIERDHRQAQRRARRGAA